MRGGADDADRIPSDRPGTVRPDLCDSFENENSILLSPPQRYSQIIVPVPPRLTYIDLTRGLIMVIMAWDHVKDLLHAGGNGSEPPMMWDGAPVGTSFPAVNFILRAVSHICAPGFFFTMGMGMWLFCLSRVKRNWSLSSIAWHYIKRSVVLLLVGRLTQTGFAVASGSWMQQKPGTSTFSMHNALFFFQVMTGLAMVMFFMGVFIPIGILIQRTTSNYNLLGALSTFLGLSSFAISNGAILWGQSGHPGVDLSFWPRGHFPASGLWQDIVRFVLIPGVLSNGGMAVYPLVPWVGFTLLGFASGVVLKRPLHHQRRVATIFATACAVLFVAIRLWGGFFGNYRGGPRGETIVGLNPWIDFFNVTKYPPSPAYACLTLAIVTSLMIAFSFGPQIPPQDSMVPKSMPRKVSEGILVNLNHFGCAPLFFYVLHIWLIAIFSLILRLLPIGMKEGVPWNVVVIVWLWVVAILAPLCSRYVKFKQSTSPESLWRLL